MSDYGFNIDNIFGNSKKGKMFDNSNGILDDNCVGFCNEFETFGYSDNDFMKSGVRGTKSKGAVGEKNGLGYDFMDYVNYSKVTGMGAETKKEKRRRTVGRSESSILYGLESLENAGENSANNVYGGAKEFARKAKKVKLKGDKNPLGKKLKKIYAKRQKAREQQLNEMEISKKPETAEFTGIGTTSEEAIEAHKGHLKRKPTLYRKGETEDDLR